MAKKKVINSEVLFKIKIILIYNKFNKIKDKIYI